MINNKSPGTVIDPSLVSSKMNKDSTKFYTLNFTVFEIIGVRK